MFFSCCTRDSHKPIHRDRSLSPSPFLTQPKAPPPKASSSSKTPSSSSSSHLNPPKKQHGPALGPSSNKKPKSSSKHVTKSEFAGKNLTVNPKPGLSGNNLKAEKRPSKIVKANSQPTVKLTSTGGHKLLNPKSGGLEPHSTQDISPLRSSLNPTPEPGAVPPKRARVSFSSSSSSSGSSSSDSDSVGETTVSHDSHVMSQRAAIPAVHSIPMSQPNAPKGSHAFPQKLSSINPSSLHPPQKAETSRPLSRSSSAGQPSQPLSRAAMLSFVDQASVQLLNRTPPSGHDMRPSSGTQPLTTQTLSLNQRPLGDKPAGVAGGGHTGIISSSSSSESDSSSGSSSSDSSSDSDEETNREVVSDQD